jgi:ATP-dependent metalloprotease
MVRQYGYSDVVGPVSAADSEELSPSTRSMIDGEVRRMLEEAKQRAFDVLTTNKHKLETLANALIEYETLDKSEVLKVLAGEKIEKEVP